MKSIIVIVLSLVCLSAWAVNGGQITGQVTDSANHQSIIGANVQIISNGKMVKAVVTDMDGYFTLSAIPAGTYHLQISYVGYNTENVEGIRVYSDQATTINFALSNVIMEGAVIVARSGKNADYIDLGHDGITERFGALEIEKSAVLPKDLVGFAVGAYQEDLGKPVTFRGSRVGTTLYIVDGMRIIGEPNLPQRSEEEILIFDGGIPAKFGDTVGGVVVINTKQYHFY